MTETRYAKIKFATRIEALAAWLSQQTGPLTAEQIAAAPAPSPMSATVAAYTLPSDQLCDALKALGYTMTQAQGRYTVSAIQPEPAPKPRARKTATAIAK
jgi:hypothetical protein